MGEKLRVNTRRIPRWLVIILAAAVAGALWFGWKRMEKKGPEGAYLTGGVADMHVAKVVELVGQSNESWFHAVEQAVAEAAQTIEHISGVEVYNLTANVRDGNITEWKANVKLAFAIDPARRKGREQLPGQTRIPQHAGTPGYAQMPGHSPINL